VKKIVLAAITGALFGTGLLLSGMTRPMRVLGFLDFTHHWDPTLAFVMIGAIAMHAVAFRMILKRERPLFEDQFQVPPKGMVDRKLVAGAVLFGLGWGTAGYCPGPALVSAASGATGAIVFCVAMTLGMLGFSQWPGRTPPYPR